MDDPAQAARRLAGGNRLLAALFAALAALLRQLARTLHLLWLEIAGVFFLLFAVIGAGSAWREWAQGNRGSVRLVVSICFSVLFAWFAGTSFWRARRKR